MMMEAEFPKVSAYPLQYPGLQNIVYIDMANK